MRELAAKQAFPDFFSTVLIPESAQAECRRYPELLESNESVRHEMNEPSQQSAAPPPTGTVSIVAGVTQKAARWLGVLSDISLAVVGVITIFAFAARFSWAADLCCQFRVQLLMILALATIIYWIWRRGTIAWWLLMCAIANLLPLLPYVVPTANPKVSPDAQVTRIMMLNLLQGNQHHDEVVDFVKTHAPDLFVAIEADDEWTEGLKPIRSLFPHRHIIDDRGTSSIAVYSQLPLDSVAIHLSTRRQLPSLDFSVTIEQRSIRIFATHPYIPLTREKASLRNEQLDNIEQVLSQGESRILLGDFNCVPWSPHFADLQTSTGLTPAGYGRGLRPTWYRRARAYGPLRQTWLFALKLDHVLLSDDLTVVDHWIGPCLGSDHRPVIVDFVPAATTTAKSR